MYHNVCILLVITSACILKSPLNWCICGGGIVTSRMFIISNWQFCINLKIYSVQNFKEVYKYLINIIPYSMEYENNKICGLLIYFLVDSKCLRWCF